MRDVTGNGGEEGKRRFITKAPSSTHDLQILEEPPEMHLSTKPVRRNQRSLSKLQAASLLEVLEEQGSSFREPGSLRMGCNSGT